MSRTSLLRRSNGSEASRRAETFLPSRRYRIPMRVYVVDNGGQWTHREWRGVEELRGGTKNVPEEIGRAQRWTPPTLLYPIPPFSFKKKKKKKKILYINKRLKTYVT